MRTTLAAVLGLAMLASPAALSALTDAAADAPDFGDDSSDWANDGECDDMRFSGPGMTATPLLADDIGTDATDCRDAFLASTIYVGRLFRDPASPRDIIWGDDASSYARNQECDDLRFTGYYASRMTFLHEDVGHDATDCRTLFARGIARWKGIALDS